MKKPVLLIDDDPNYRMSVVNMLEDEGYHFIEADSPGDGIRILDTKPQVRVILLDLSFGHVSGAVVLDHIKDRFEDYRVIVLTEHDELLLAEQAGAYAVFNYLPKAQRSSKQAIRFSIDQAFRDLERQHLDQKIRFLLDVQKQINDQRPTKETLDLICQSVRAMVGAYTCHIRVYDFDRGDYHLGGFAAAEERLRHAFERPRAKGDLFSGRVVESGKAESFDDLQNMEEFRSFASKALERPEVSSEEEDYFRTVRSAYIIPISTGLFETAVDAVLNVSSESLAFFDAGRRALVDEFVTQAALTITKDWLQRKRKEIHQDYSRISGMLSEITERLKGTDVLQGIYDVVTRRISEIVNPELVSIFLYNEATGLIENVAELRGSEPVEALNEVYRPGESLIGAVFEREETLQLPEPGDAKRVKPLNDTRYNHSGREEYLNIIPSGGLEHYLGVPIAMGGKVLGVLRAMNKKSKYYDEASASHDRLCLLERGFSADCRNVMEITARHLAVAIRNAELLKEKERRVEQVQTLGEVGRLINSALDIKELLKLTIREMAEVMQAEICMLFLKSGEDRIVLRECFGMPMIPDAFYEIGEGVTGRVAETGEPRLIVGHRPDQNDGKYDPVIRAFLTDKYGTTKHIDSLMVVPIIAKSTIFGTMKVINKKNDHLQYTESDLHLFRTFADYVGVAIENAQVYKHLSLLVSAVAHEINNTSGVIPANVAGIKAKLGEPNENIDRMLALIEDAASQATEFANEIAGFSVTGEKQPKNVNLVIQNAITALDLQKYRVPEAIALDVSLSDSPLVCEIYEKPFAQIVRNIVINAFQALETKQGGVVSVSSSMVTVESAGTAVIRFEDTGPGIKPEHKSRIFDADFTTKAKGNGIGLWLVRTQLQAVGGTIEVESEAGGGATFIVKVPLAREREEGRAL
jgi:signal transduction histidine kinase/CheY-like chemotaxis protein